MKQHENNILFKLVSTEPTVNLVELVGNKHLSDQLTLQDNYRQKEFLASPCWLTWKRQDKSNTWSPQPPQRPDNNRVDEVYKELSLAVSWYLQRHDKLRLGQISHMSTAPEGQGRGRVAEITIATIRDCHFRGLCLGQTTRLLKFYPMMKDWP